MKLESTMSASKSYLVDRVGQKLGLSQPLSHSLFN